MRHLPGEAMRRYLPGEHGCNFLLDTNEDPRPVHGHEELPIEITQLVYLLVAGNHLVLVTTPRQSKVRDAIVSVGGLEVENPRQALRLEEEIPSGKVAVQHDGLGSFHIDG